MKKLFIIFIFFNTQVALFSQPGAYYYLCFNLYDSTNSQIDSTSMENDYKFRMVNFDDAGCRGYGFSGQINDTSFYCLKGSKECIIDNVFQIVDQNADTMRIFFQYKSKDIERYLLRVDSIMYKKGNYIIKSPPKFSDWKNINTIDSNIQRIDGNLCKYKKKIYDWKRTKNTIR